MRAIAASLLATALLLAGAAPASADRRSPHPKCHPKGSEGLANGGRARIFRVPRPPVDGDDHGGFRTYACDLLSGRRTVLHDASSEDESFTLVRAEYAGRVVGMHTRTCFRAQCGDEVASVDVVTRRRVRAGVFEAPHRAFVVAPSGSIAWIQFHKVHRASADGTRAELDAGPVEPGSLALAANGRLHWTTGGLPRSAPLDAVGPTAPQRPDPSIGGSRACYPKGSRTRGSGPRARVYETAAAADGTVAFAVCNLRTGRRAEVTAIDDNAESYSLEHVRFAGWFVATAGRGCLKVDCGAGDVRLIDLRSGATRDLGGEAGQVRTTDLQLLADGTIAWILERGSVREVMVCSATCRKLDSGTEVEPGSLALTPGGRAYWIGAGGVPRSGERP